MILRVWFVLGMFFFVIDICCFCIGCVCRFDVVFLLLVQCIEWREISHYSFCLPD